MQGMYTYKILFELRVSNKEQQETLYENDESYVHVLVYDISNQKVI